MDKYRYITEDRSGNRKEWPESMSKDQHAQMLEDVANNFRVHVYKYSHTLSKTNFSNELDNTPTNTEESE